jgi:hypothetical protein
MGGEGIIDADRAAGSAEILDQPQVRILTNRSTEKSVSTFRSARRDRGDGAARPFRLRPAGWSWRRCAAGASSLVASRAGMSSSGTGRPRTRPSPEGRPVRPAARHPVRCSVKRVRCCTSRRTTPRFESSIPSRLTSLRSHSSRRVSAVALGIHERAGGRSRSTRASGGFAL